MLAAKRSYRCLDDGRRRYLDPRAQAMANEAEREMSRSMICDPSRGDGLRRISEAIGLDEGVMIYALGCVNRSTVRDITIAKTRYSRSRDWAMT